MDLGILKMDEKRFIWSGKNISQERSLGTLKSDGTPLNFSEVSQ